MRVRMTVMAALATLAGSVGLYPLFSSGPWFWTGFGAVLAVAAGGLLVRRFRAPAIFSALGGLACLHLYLTARFAAGEAWLGIVPTPSSMRLLGDLFDAGWEHANRYAAPVPLAPGIELLATAGIGVVAVLVDLLAVRLRRAAPAGLPLLAMYSVPAAVREDSINWLAFGLGAMGYLLLLTADARERMGGWGRLVLSRRWSGEVGRAGEPAPSRQVVGRPDATALAASGRRIGFAAVVLAVLVPTALPGIRPNGVLGLGGEGPGSGSGTQTITTPDPLVSLKRELTRADDSVVLTYTTDDEEPGYLRLYALDRFDGDRWTYSPLQSTSRDRVDDGRLPEPPGLTDSPTTDVTTKITVRPQVRNMTFLPAPYAPSRVRIEGSWRVHNASLMLYSLRDGAAGRTYTVESIKARPTPELLRSGGTYPDQIVHDYTAVPRDVPWAVRDLTRKVVAGAPTAHGQAVRIQRWFTHKGGFTYDLTAPAPQRGNDLADFLLRSKRGYCEQFAASMALMARLAGIPARVAMGYTPGTMTEPGRWVVRSRDAHAWPELYFPGTGWVRFEPTPAGATGQGTARPPAYSDPAMYGGGSSGSEPDATEGGGTPDTQGEGQQGRANRPETRASDPAAERGDRDGGGSFPTGWLAGATLVVMLLAAPMAVRALGRRRRWAAAVPDGPGPPHTGGGGRGPDVPLDAAHAAWREMRADVLDHGLPWRASDTPRTAARRLGELLELDPDSAEALTRIARAEEQARYARAHPHTPPEALRADVRTVRTAIAASVDRRARLRARYLPPSGMDAFRGAGRDATGRAGAVLERTAMPVRHVWHRAVTKATRLSHRLRRRP